MVIEETLFTIEIDGKMYNLNPTFVELYDFEVEVRITADFGNEAIVHLLNRSDDSQEYKFYYSKIGNFTGTCYVNFFATGAFEITELVLDIFFAKQKSKQKSFEELYTEGKTFKEINEAMKTKQIPLVSPDGTKRFEFVEGEVESGKKAFNEGLTIYERKR